MAAKLARTGFAWICVPLALLTCQPPQSKPSLDPVAAEKRVHTLGDEIRAAAERVRASGDTDGASVKELTAIYETQVHEMGDWVLALGRESTIQSIRVEELVRTSIEESSREIADAEETIRAEADRCAMVLTPLATSRTSSQTATLVRDSRDAWYRAITATNGAIEDMNVKRKSTIAERTQKKRIAYRAALDVKRQFEEAVGALLSAARDESLRQALTEYRDRVASQLTVNVERGRLAQERASTDLDQYLTSRTEALRRAEKELDAHWNALSSANFADESAVKRHRGDLLTGMALALRDLAERNQASIASQSEAFRELWRRSEPARAADQLDTAERKALLGKRRDESKALHATSQELERIRRDLDAIRKRAALD